MSKCIDESIGSMVHAYELGLLSEEDANAVEIHLLECSYCNERFLELAETARTLRSDAEIRAVIKDLASHGQPPAESGPAKTTAETGSRRTNIARFLVVAAAAVVLLVLRPWNIRIETEDPVVAADNRVAIMPFGFLASEADTAKLAEVVTSLLITDLSESRYLQVLPGNQLVNHTEYLSSRDSTLSSTDGERAAIEKVRVGWILTGDILQVQPQFVITARLSAASDGSIVQSLRVVGDSAEGVFKVVDRLAARIREELLTPVESQDEFDPAVADVTTQSAEAYRWYLEGVELYGRKHFDEAEDCYRRAVEHDSTFAMGWYCLAFHGVPNAVENAVRFSARASHKEQLYIHSLAARRQGDIAKAEALLKELVERYPDEKIGWMEVAWIAWEDRRYEEAVDYLRHSLQADPLYVDAIDMLAHVYNDMGEFEKALSTINETIELEPDEPNPYVSKGDILARNGNLDEAVRNYEHGLELKPDFAAYRPTLELGRLYVYQGRYDDARAAMRNVVSSGGASLRSQARAMLALVTMYQGRLSQAESELADAFAADRLENAADISPGTAAYKYFIRSRLHLAREDYNGAVASLRQSLQLVERAGPYYQMTYSVHYAHALALAGYDDSAQQVIDDLKNRYSETRGGLSAARKAEGLVAFAGGHDAEAIEHLSNIADPNWLGFDTRYVQARANLNLGHYTTAAVELRQALSDYSDLKRLGVIPWAVDAYYYLATAEEHAGQTTLAVEHYEEFLSVWSGADSSLTLVRDAESRLRRLKAGS